ncbi:alpha/beta fold hydrolase [Planococcus shenhongbingii]|uniref:Alpha/beta hydrolase n=1 Tax=Planococcus shenhongbingii TaxID=3058398 RepID=A0ABT8NBW5_9BACL|nr:alpha/beta hydrolase [Planococcus sp. N017]MDN7245167.1 alpha/beta hydrolase [Planococcus sp. N017]
MSNYQVKELITEGFKTVYCHGGETNAETLIFLHGSGPGANALSNWKKALNALSSKYQVIALDLVGFGSTELPADLNMTFWEWTTLRVKQVLAIMDHYNIGKAHLVGNSMGGVISLNAVMHSPQRFDKLILMGSGGGKTSGPTPEIVRMTGFFNDPTIESFGNLIRWFMYDETVLEDDINDIIRTRYENIMRPEVRELYPKLFPKNPAEMLIPPSALRRMTNQTLLIHGYEDQFVPREGSLSLLEHIPNAELILLKQCGHWVQIEKSDRFIQLVDQFIDQRNHQLALI